MFKKIFFGLCTIVLVLTLAGCGEKNIEGDLKDLMAKIDSNLSEDWKSRLMVVDLTKDNVEQFLGTNDIDFESAIAEEHMTGSVAYSVILIRASKNANIEEMKTKIKENINPRKWICVGVEDDEVIIKNRGDLIIVIVVKDEGNRKLIEQGFDNL